MHTSTQALALSMVSLLLSASSGGSTSPSTSRGSSPPMAFVTTLNRPAALLLEKPGHLASAVASNGCRRRRYARTRPYAMKRDVVHHSNVVERLELGQQFERWRFMQKLLDAEIPPSDVEEVLLLTLESYLRHGPTATSPNNKNENGGYASPVLTEDQKDLMTEVLDVMGSASDGIGDSRFLHMLVLPPVDYASLEIDTEEPDVDNLVEVDADALSILEGIEKLLPDPEEDEESHKGAWDVVIDLHGRESVRMREESLQAQRKKGGGNVVLESGSGLKCCGESLQWRTLCTVGRLLIHFDFLTKGVLKEGTFR
ncbi:hypothetical protein ACHAWF_006888 [Thalassiosira exigua]